MGTLRIGAERVDDAKLLVALYNHTRAIGRGVIHDRPGGISLVEAQQILEKMEKFDFDYLYGRPIKITAQDGVIDDVYYYERDAGEGEFAAALKDAQAS